jgi:hypothetical protein
MQKGERMRIIRMGALLLALTIAIVTTPLVASAQPKGERVTIQGEVVDMWCYLEGGDRGAPKKQCATTCARAGNPIAILDAKGQVFVAAGLKSHQPARELLVNKMSENVTVTGILVKNGGAQMIYIESVK